MIDELRPYSDYQNSGSRWLGAHDQALAKVTQHLLKDDTQVYKQFVENESFKRFVGDMVFAMTNSGGPSVPPVA